MQQTETNPASRKYRELHDQIALLELWTRNSARTIFDLLFQRYRPRSVLDLGCGSGIWLAVAREMGVERVYGVEGPWLDRSRLVIEPGAVRTANLEEPLTLGGERFDLVICLETAEHLKPSAADTLIKSLVSHAPLVLFSAAVPYQRGPGHVNEQWPGYWGEKFAQHHYSPLDFLRKKVWFDSRVLWWYRQNILLFADVKWCQSQPLLIREAQIQNLQLQPLSVVLPELYETWAKKLQELEQALIKGGDYKLEHDEHGLLHLTPAEKPLDQASAHVKISKPHFRAGSAWDDLVAN